MSVLNKVSINTHYTRSVNLERDSDSLAIVKSYIPTSRARRTLERVAESFTQSASQRAWSLVGPYGSGKSSFSVFMSQLLSKGDLEVTQAAFKVLSKADDELADTYRAETRNSEGYLKVLITGSPEPLSGRFIEALLDAATDLWASKRGKKPAILTLLKRASTKKDLSTHQIINLVIGVQEALCNTKGNTIKGLLIVIDELGKFLEYEARHYGANDIYLLQALAEHAYKGSQVNILLFVMLHQSFEQYAKGLGESLKQEWSKVQGRYEEVPFLETAEQILRVVSVAINQNFTPKEEAQLKKNVKRIVTTLDKQKALPSSLKHQEAIELFSSCYPLHPLSAILLPSLCQRIAQNERTLFSYLGSSEPFGAQDVIKHLADLNDWIYPHQIYDYFISNRPAIVSDHITSRRWAEVATALERLGDAPVEQRQILKTIGILNIIGSKGGLKASDSILATCVSVKSKVDEILAKLEEQSLISYRQFSGEYRVWQGSDFDIDEALDEELSKLGKFSLAKEINARKSLLPVVARRYTIKNGALRYFVPIFVDAQSYLTEPIQSEYPRVIFFLVAGQDDEKLFKKQLTNYFSAMDILVLVLNGTQVREAVAEVLALGRVGRNRQELNSDPIAKREFEDRYRAATRTEEVLLQGTLDSPNESEWYWNGQKLPVHSKRSMQEQMSYVLEEVYKKAPQVQNELINRDKPSSQAAAARNKLLAAMVSHPQNADLGIIKFPPEKAIYRSVLRESGLHKEIKPNQWAFVPPIEGMHLYPAWQEIETFLASTEKKPRAFSELNEILAAPPYGIKLGVLPILHLATILNYEHELALYEQRRYTPYLSTELLERFVKRPDEFTVQRFRIEGMRASIFEQYSQALFGGAYSKKQCTVIDFARPIAKFIGELEDYTKKTKSSELSQQAKQVRNAFNLAKSPEQLLFEDIPMALGFKPDEIEQLGESGLEGFANQLMDSLRELKHCFPNLIETQKANFAQAFRLGSQHSIDQLRSVISGRYSGLDQYTIDVDGLKAFIKRLTKSEGDSEQWFNNVLMFLGQKPIEKWTDADRNEADLKLNDYSKRLLDLETVRVYHDRTADHMEGDFDVILLRSLKQGSEPINEVVAIDNKRHEAIQEVKAAVNEALAEHKSRELQLAVLAEVVDEFLHKYRAENVKSANVKAKRTGKLKNVQ